MRALTITPAVLALAAILLRADAPCARVRGAARTAFEQNRGQFDARVRYLASAGDARVSLDDEGATVSLGAREAPDRVDLRLHVEGGRSVRPCGTDRMRALTSYFVGAAPSAWHTRVPSFARVTYPQVSDGVDLVFHGEGGRLEYDVLVAPHMDPSSVTFDLDGAGPLAVTPGGELAVQSPRGVLVEPPPRAYQREGGEEREVAAAFRLLGPHRFGFSLGAYDSAEPLVIDPVLAYGTYLAGQVYAVAADSAGDTFAAGWTSSSSFPGVHVNPSAGDAFVTRMDSDGASVLFTAVLGGISGVTIARSVAIDSSGAMYVTGTTGSATLPLVNAFQSSPGGAFVAKIDPSGSTLVYSSYFGGAGDSAYGIAVDSSGGAYVTGSTSWASFPATSAFPSGVSLPAAFVAKVAPSGSTLAYAALLGGDGTTYGQGIAVDASRDAYVVGTTSSRDFPTTASAFQTTAVGTNQNLTAGFVTKLGADGSSLLYSTYLAGTTNNDQANAVALDSSGAAYVTGAATSSDFPTQGPIQPSLGGGVNDPGDAFVTKLAPSGSALVYSTFLGGSQLDDGLGIAVDSSGAARVVGSTNSTNFPSVSPIPSPAGGQDAFVTQVDANGTAWTFSSRFGSSGDDEALAVAVDGRGAAYVVGQTPSTSTNFPLASPIVSTPGAGFAIKVESAAPGITPGSASVPPQGTETFTPSGGSGAPYLWSLAANDSNGTIDSSGHYKAGPIGGSRDVVTLQDSSGNTITAVVTVGADVSLNNPAPEVEPLAQFDFTASGGNGAPYAWSITTTTGGTLSASGVYTAGAIGGARDVVRVTDALGNTAQAIVIVAPSVAITPASAAIAPLGVVHLAATGGTPSYTWALASNTSGGSVDSTGRYQAGPVGGVSDVVSATDTLGVSGRVTIVVSTRLAIEPPALASVPPLGTLTLQVTGGADGGYRWSLLDNASGGSIAPTSGVYVAGRKGNVTDVVHVIDSLDAGASLDLGVGPSVTIAPSYARVAPGASTAFTATGGSGTGYTWTLASSPSGGTITSAGVYTAGAAADATDEVRATDSLGNAATAPVQVLTAGSDAGSVVMLTDSGAPAGPTDAALGSDGSTPEPTNGNSGGCSCRVVSDRRASPRSLAALLVLVVALAVRRRGAAREPRARSRAR